MYDELELDKLGDRKTALFLSIYHWCASSTPLLFMIGMRR